MKQSGELNRDIKDSVRRLYEAKQDYNKAAEYLSKVKKKEQVIISNYMFQFLGKGVDSFVITLDEGQTYYDNHTTLRVKKVRRKSINWFVDKLKEKLTKEQCKKVIDKTYTVNDMESLVKYLKTCGVDPKKFKKYIDVNETVNAGNLDQLYSIGEVSKKDIDGCYEVNIGEPYIMLTEEKK